MRFILLLIRSIWRLVSGPFRPAQATRPHFPAAPAATTTPPDDAFDDTARGRRIPYRVYEPDTRDGGPAPVVLFSHGLGGTCDAAPYLGRALAAAGYWGIFLQHPGTDRAALQGSGSPEALRRRLQNATRDIALMRDRFLDIPFVLDGLQRLNATPGHRFHGRLDLDRIGMAGHSYGARTVLAAVGQRIGRGGRGFRDGRIRAGVLLSPSSTRRPGATEDRQAAAGFSGISVPLLHVTGTRDAQGPGGEGPIDIAHRLRPFQLIPAREQYLLVLDGARHGDLVAGDDEVVGDDRYRRLISVAVLLFLDAQLRREPSARTALRTEFAAQLAPRDRFEFR